jgi:hypothetical protein
LRSVNKYIGKLDQRLSIPKFTKDHLESDSPASNRRSILNGNGTNSPKGQSQQDRERIRRSKYRGGSMMMPLSSEQKDDVLKNISRPNYATTHT